MSWLCTPKQQRSSSSSNTAEGLAKLPWALASVVGHSADCWTLSPEQNAGCQLALALLVLCTCGSSTAKPFEKLSRTAVPSLGAQRSRWVCLPTCANSIRWRKAIKGPVATKKKGTFRMRRAVRCPQCETHMRKTFRSGLKIWIEHVACIGKS